MGTLANVTVEPVNATWGELDMGFLEGDVEVAIDEQAVDITAHQEGTNVLDAIRTGKNVEITLTMKEAIAAKIAEIIEAGGAESTPTAEVQTITVPTASVAGINSKYFDIYIASDATTYRVWFDVNNTGVAPSSTGVTLVEVNLDATPTQAEIVTALQGALDALAGFVATESSNVVTVTNASTGPTSPAEDTGATGFTFAVVTEGIGTVVGWGNSKDFVGMKAHAQKLVLHPAGLADSDLSKDLAFWKAYPRLDSLTYSGENPKLAALTFRIFPDETRQDAVRLFIQGDHR